MKKRTNSFRFLTILITACSLFITSCGHDPIFNIIESEVKPEKNGISGHINNFVTFKQNLYIANNFLYEKPLVSSAESNVLNGGWTRIADSSTDSFNGRQIVFIAADSNYLYAYTITYGLNESRQYVPDSVILFYSPDARNWEQIDDEHFSSILSSNFKEDILQTEKKGAVILKKTNAPIRYILKIFDNQAVSDADKNAYVVLLCDRNAKGDEETKLYKLNGNEAPVEIPAGTNNSLNKNTIVDVTSGSSANPEYSPRCSISAVNYKGNDYFFEYTGVIADSNYLYFSPNNNKVYVADGWDPSKRIVKVSGILKSYSIENYGFTLNGETAKTVSINCGNILSLGITNDMLLLGTESGIAHVSFDSERIPGTDRPVFATNAASVLHSPYNVISLFVFDSTKNELDNDLYAANEYPGYYSTSTTALFEDIGLWAYYPSRGNWNKDGTSAGKNKKTHLPAGN